MLPLHRTHTTMDREALTAHFRMSDTSPVVITMVCLFHSTSCPRIQLVGPFLSHLLEDSTTHHMMASRMVGESPSPHLWQSLVLALLLLGSRWETEWCSLKRKGQGFMAL